MILEQAGFTVLLAATAEEAAQIERDFTDTIDLVLTSVSLPRGSGPELAAQLARRRPGLKAMLMSGYADVRTLAANYGWSFIGKPFLPSALLDGIREALDPAVAVIA
jgi:DNA-binding NtrC family response regulator